MADAREERERFARVKTSFLGALELADAERARFIEELRASDEALAAEVEDLLAAHRLDDDPFADVVAGIANAAGDPEPPDEDPFAAWIGQRVGSHRIERILGRGGMGVVFLAHRADGELDQQVAIKLVRPECATPELLRRFRAERQVLANLAHPNIARLLDAGATDTGLPYLVMEYVAGVDLDTYCDTHALGMRERLALFVTVCDAVEHAHRSLVIHRDLKPANILVTESGEVKLLDFGVAKLLAEGLEGERLEETHGAPGALTPAFASPEQLTASPITTASDVYSLGIVLYRLLTGRHPFALSGRSYAELTREACGRDTLPPSAQVRRATGSPVLAPPVADPRRLARLLAGDLDAIAARATEPSPTARYPSAIALAQEVERYLDGLPVEARRGNRRYRIVKLARRHRLSIAAGALLLVSLIGGSLATAWEARRAFEQRAVADRRFQELRRLAHAVVFDYHDALQDVPGSTAVRARMVQDALTYLDGLARDASGDAALARELAAAYRKIGDVQGNAYYANLGDARGAVASYRKSLALRQRLLDASPSDREATRELAESEVRLADVLWDTGDLAETRRSYEHARAVLEGAHQLHPEDLRIANDLGQVDAQLGDLYGNASWANLGDVDQAIALHRAGLVLRQAMMDAQPGDSTARYNLAVGQQLLADVLVQNRRFDEAETLAQRAVATAETLLTADPGSQTVQRAVAIGTVTLGDVARERLQLEEARARYQRGVDTFGRSVEADPANRQGREDLETASARLGDVLAGLGLVADARRHGERALALGRELVAFDPDNRLGLTELAECHATMARIALAAERPAEAIEELAEALALRESLAQRDVSDVQAVLDLAAVHGALGRARLAAQDRVGASTELEQATALGERYLSDHPRTPAARIQVARDWAELAQLLAASTETVGSADRDELPRRASEALERARSWLVAQRAAAPSSSDDPALTEMVARLDRIEAAIRAAASVATRSPAG